MYLIHVGFVKKMNGFSPGKGKKKMSLEKKIERTKEKIKQLEEEIIELAYFLKEEGYEYQLDRSMDYLFSSEN